VIGTVRELWQYPVKSLQGERVLAVALDDTGPVGDRAWGVLDVATGELLSAKRTGVLLEAAVRGSTVTLPTGAAHDVGTAALDAALAEWLGREVRLVHVRDEASLPQSMHLDNEDLTSLVIRWRSPRGRYVDLFPLHFLTTATLASAARAHPDLDWDVRRFRPNLVIDTVVHERELLGATLRMGEAVVRVPEQLTERCVMTTRAQNVNGLDAQRSLLRTLARDAGNADAALTAGSGTTPFGAYLEVVSAGRVAEGDPVERLS
jgi:uncharacterized protein YcbX